MNLEKMRIGDAYNVVTGFLDDVNVSVTTKVKAIEMVANMETHNSLSKRYLVSALRFLFKTYDFATDNNDGHKPMTNGDRIRAMTDEEQEDFIRAIAVGYEPWCDRHCKMDGDGDCNECLKKWIKQPVKGM